MKHLFTIMMLIMLGLSVSFTVIGFMQLLTGYQVGWGPVLIGVGLAVIFVRIGNDKPKVKHP